MPLSEGFIALPTVYLVRLDELRLKKSFYKLFQANPDVRFRDSAFTEKSTKFTWLCYEQAVHEIV